jgi:hypothetical protein
MEARIFVQGLLGICILAIVTSTVQGQNLLIRGGTLVDGTGKPPIQNANILVEGGRVRQIWVGDALAERPPLDTQIIEGTGKYILPGLIDSHVHYREYMGEMFLAHGVTTVYDLGNPVPWLLAVKQGLNEGKIRGPRFYFCGRINVGEGGSGSGPTVRSGQTAVMKGPEGAPRAVAILRMQADCVKLTEFMQEDVFAPIAREARAAGLGVISHSLNAFDSAKWGITGIEHMTGIALATIRSPEGRRAVADMSIEAGHKNTFLYQWMEPALFDDLIKFLVDRNVFINPTLHFEWKALSEHARDHELEDTRLLNHPNVQYVPLSERLVFLGQYHWADGATATEREQFLQGYRRVQEFLRRFVRAGGKIYSGTDTAAALTPGLSIHHEMELLVDAGLTPMQAIQSSTLWAAEIIGLQQQIGSVEPGKLADLLILQRDPLRDIRNTKEVAAVIRGGEVVDTNFHSDYQFPFLRYGPESKHLYNPIPVLNDIQPPTARQGTEAELRILGRGFVPSSVVRVGELRMPTRWVSGTELSVKLGSLHTSNVGTVLVTVETPLPGGGLSDPLELYITFP